MRIPWSSVWAVAKAVYTAFLKGKVVDLPWGIGPVTLPQRDHTIPLSLYAAQSEALNPYPPAFDRRAPKPAPRADGLPEPCQPPMPLSVQTLAVVLFVVFGLPILGLTIFGVLEWRTLSDDVPGNHITATMRAAFHRAPGAVFLATLVWVGFLVAVGMGLAAHFWFA
jgi:hypothetical protein